MDAKISIIVPIYNVEPYVQWAGLPENSVVDSCLNKSLLRKDFALEKQRMQNCQFIDLAKDLRGSCLT